MNRRDFFAVGLTGALSAATFGKGQRQTATTQNEEIRDAFPRLKEETYLNAAGMMPLGTFSLEGLHQYLAFQQLGPADGRGTYVRDMQSQIRSLFAALIGAEESEVGLVHCTKAGEQIVLDALEELRQGKNIVTNDLHFTGSLHNLIGLQQAGRDVRIVRARDWAVPFEAMEAAIDDRTALVAVSLVSNINGHVEDIEALSRLAHAHGALVYADIIQAAGIVPLDVKQMGIDVAACSCYKWLYGVHGTGFLFVRQALQGTRLPDHLFPGRAHHNYAPWVEHVDAAHGDFIYEARHDARRYQPGHVSYLGYCAAYEGLKFLQEVGVENALAHSMRLNHRLKAQLDPDRYRCISPDVDRSPIITFITKDPDAVRQRLMEAKVVVSLGGNRMRVSPALYNNEADIDLLTEVLNR